MASAVQQPSPEQVQAALLRAIERTGVRFMVTPKRPAEEPAPVPKRRRRTTRGV
jgi:hypothetical protein